MLVPALIAVLLYLPSLGYDFVRDDRQLVLDNPAMRDPGWLGRLMVSDYWGSAGGNSGLWRPWTLLTLWVDGRLGGWSPAWFHATNVMIHAVAAALLASAVLASGAGAVVAALAGLWFAAMPSHVEAVGWIVGRTDLWCCAFALLALRLDLARTSRAAAILAPVAFALALLSKESAAALFVVLLVQRMRSTRGAERSGRELLRGIAPYAAVLAAWAAGHAAVTGRVPPGGHLSDAGLAIRTALATPAALVAQLWPGAVHGPDLALDRPGTALVASGGLILVAGVVALVLMVRRRSSVAVPLALLWTPLAALAALVAMSRAALFGERHLVLPSAGAAWLAALPVAGGRPLRVVATLALLGITAWSAAATNSTLPAWRNEDTMYAAMARTQPRNATAPLGLALLELESGRNREARSHLDEAESLDASRFEIPLYRAMLAVREGEFERADSLARLAEARGGWNRDARYARALAMQGLGRWPESRVLLEELRARDLSDTEVAWAWATQLTREGRFPEAADAYQRLLAIQPDDYEAWLALAVTRAATGDRAGARNALDRASQLPGASDGRAAALRARLTSADSTGPGLAGPGRR